MRPLIGTLTLLATAPLILAGCSTSEDAASGTSAAPTTAASTEGAGTTDTAETVHRTASEETTTSKSAPPAADKTSASAAKLSLTMGSKKTEIKPTDVYCSGSKGHIHHIIGKTNNRPPLVEANGTHFVMAKIGQGKPYRSERPNGVSYAANSVTFHQVSVGSAVLDGTMACTAWNN